MTRNELRQLLLGIILQAIKQSETDLAIGKHVKVQLTDMPEMSHYQLKKLLNEIIDDPALKDVRVGVSSLGGLNLSAKNEQ